VGTSTQFETSEIEASRVGAARLLAAVADPVRWRLLAQLADGETRCVCDLQPVAAVAANLLSYHLKVLREAGLVRARRRGRWMDYTIAADALDRLHAALPSPGAGHTPAAGSACPPQAGEHREVTAGVSGGLS
jgi:ArsR family transcriptional regulator